MPFLLKTFSVFFVLSTFFALFSSNAFAYNRTNAANYADRWALSRNGAWPSYSSDCTNFMSQAMNAGGDGMNGTWHAQNYFGIWDVTLGWDNANSNYQYETQNNRAHVAIKVNASNGAYFNHYNSLIAGDMLYFDWGQGEGLSHAALQVGPGTSHYDASWVGDLSDQHVTDRLHVSWNHIEVNANWGTTTIWEVVHA